MTPPQLGAPMPPHVPVAGFAAPEVPVRVFVVLGTPPGRRGCESLVEDAVYLSLTDAAAAMRGLARRITGCRTEDGLPVVECRDGRTLRVAALEVVPPHRVPGVTAAEIADALDAAGDFLDAAESGGAVRDFDDVLDEVPAAGRRSAGAGVWARFAAMAEEHARRENAGG